MKSVFFHTISVIGLSLWAFGSAVAEQNAAQPRASGDADHDSAEIHTDRVHGSDHVHNELEEVRVTATPMARNALEMTQSASVLADEALHQELSTTLGDTLKNMPGVASASFGANLGRPVIRGMDASRVGVLENNMSSNDLSRVSQDHAVSIEPFLADQIEVLRGPATLLYGSETIGGVVNVRTNRIPFEAPENPDRRLLLQGDSASRQRYAAARADWGSRDLNWGFHADAFRRDNRDYEIPGFAETDPEPGENPPGRLANSAFENEGGAFGASWHSDQWRLGTAWSFYDSRYGIPGEAHHDEDPDEEAADETVRINLRSDRFDAEIRGLAPLTGIRELKLLFSDSRYTHTEFEGSEVGTLFENNAREARLEISHEPLGDWRGVVGLQYRDRDFSALGEEAFVPPASTTTRGLFILEEVQLERVRFDAGARIEDIDLRALDGRRASHQPVSLSLGALWHVNERSHFAVNLSRSQRAPGNEELFAFGPHIASQIFETGDASLSEETARGLEISFRRHAGRLTGAITLYHNDFDDFIYLASTGQQMDGLPQHQWRPADARFQGAELEVLFDIGGFASGHYQLHGFADTVDAELANGDQVPRLPARRFGLGLDWDKGAWVGGLSWIRSAAVTDTAPFETATSGHDLLELDLSWRSPDGHWEWFISGSNLLDEDIRNPVSLLKNRAPQQGRNWTVGTRIRF